MNTPTFKELYEFVLSNKKDKVFTECSNEQIQNELISGIKNNTLAYAINEENKIVGMILAEKREESKILFVTRNLAMSLSILKRFAKMAKDRFPDYKLEWLKHNIHKTHNTDKIYTKLGAI
jgi:hypothetical protein